MKTTTTTVQRLAYTDIGLLFLLALERKTAKNTADAIQRLEYEIVQRAQERGATAIITEQYTAELVPNVTYDQSRFTPLLELLPEEGVKESFIPEHQETVTVPAKWKTQQAIKWANKVGDTALRIVAAARMEGAPRVKLTEEAKANGAS